MMGSGHGSAMGLGWVGGQSASRGLLMEPVIKASVGSMSRGLGELGRGVGSAGCVPWS